tara:strand:+ start:882 stop:2612 length:1731 start_codon:yes stop_codon:yes gene_type:complete
MTLSGSKPNLLSAGRFANRAIGDDTGYNPRTDDRIYRGTRVLDAIEDQIIGGVDWWKEQSKDKEGITDDIFRLVGGGAMNIATAISYIPGIKQLGQFEDWVAAQARDLSANVAPDLDPRIAGWLARVGTGIVTDKGIGLAGRGARAGVRLAGRRVVSAIDDLTGLATGVGTAMDVSGGITDTIRRNALGEVVSVNLKGKGSRSRATKMATKGQPVRPGVPSADKFKSYGEKLQELLFGDLEFGFDEVFNVPYEIHHTAPVKVIGNALDFLTDEAIEEGAEYLAKEIGHSLGDAYQNASPTIKRLHNRAHALMNDALGHQSLKIKDPLGNILHEGVIGKLEKKYFGDRRLSDGITLAERINSGFLKELADTIVEGENLLDTFWAALDTRKNFGRMSRETYLTNTVNILEQDLKLAKIVSKKGGDVSTLTDIVNSVVGKSNRALENAINLTNNTNSQKALYDLLSQDKGMAALLDAVYNNSSIKRLQSKFGVSIKKTGVMRDVLDQVKLDKLVNSPGMTRALIDTYLQTGWAPPMWGKSSLREPILRGKPLRAKELLRDGWSIDDINEAARVFNIDFN